jgi:peptide-methionine (R)-S-oxide reductase
MVPIRIGLRLCFATAALLTLVVTIAAAPQDPFQQSQQPGVNTDSNPAGKSERDANTAAKGEPKTKSEPEFVRKTDDEWRKILTYEQYLVTRMKGTEPAFTGKYSRGHYRGMFLCVCCGAELFDAETKFESGTGWPSFWRPINDKAVTYQVDNSAAEVRTEVNCRRCGAHLGHVFPDGPPPTGARFCMNSVALKLRPLGGASANRGATSRSKSKAKAKLKAKATQKSTGKNSTQTKKSTDSAPSSSAPASDSKASDQSGSAPSSSSDRS